jgi:hypothetical protein
MLYVIYIVIIILAMVIAIISNRKDMDFSISLVIGLGCALILYFIALMSADVQEYNKLTTQIIVMPPIEYDESRYTIVKNELDSVKSIIKDVLDKYQLQVEIKSLDGLSLYAMPMGVNTSSLQGLGDIERGGGEKLKNLENLIEKQNTIANRLIPLATAKFKYEEFYKNNQERIALKYNLFSGWIIRSFGMSEAQCKESVLQNSNFKPTN